MKRILVHATLSIAVGIVALACGGTKDTAASGSGGSSSSGTGGASGSGGSSVTGSGGAGITGCDLAPCTGKQVAGQALDACCMSATTCGISSQNFMAGQCFSASALNNLPEASSFQEPIVPDPTCPATDLGDAGGGQSLAGCCDKTNFCGVAIDQTFGQMHLTLCLTPGDIAGFGMGGGFDAGAPKACTYPK
jgi:hypothetical protein